jgi:hypothetical protein
MAGQHQLAVQRAAIEDGDLAPFLRRANAQLSVNLLPFFFGCTSRDFISVWTLGQTVSHMSVMSQPEALSPEPLTAFAGHNRKSAQIVLSMHAGVGPPGPACLLQKVSVRAGGGRCMRPQSKIAPQDEFERLCNVAQREK